MAADKAWYKLDNAAKIYPPAETSSWMAMFRLSVTLTEEIDVPLLRQALGHALQRFPTFSCRLRRGLFWYYLEHIDGVPPITEDVRNPMAPLKLRENGSFLFRVRCYNKRIALEFFHVLTDGAGGMTFLLSLVAEYLRLRYGLPVEEGGYIRSCAGRPDPEEWQDSFLKYARTETARRAEPPAYQPAGTVVPLQQLLLVSGTADAERLRAAAAGYGVSVGVLLTAVALQALLRVQREDGRQRRRAVKLSVPVNLRRFYPTRTLRNFSSYVNVGIDGRYGDYTFEEILTQVRGYMMQMMTEKQLNARFSDNVLMEKKLIVRMLPLCLKAPVLRIAYMVEGDRYMTSTLSNLGLVELPAVMRPYVDRMAFLLGPPSSRRSVCACVTYRDKAVITFSRTITESKFEQYFFTSLVRMGVPVYIESNGRIE